MHYRDNDVDVRISREGMRRAYADNALLTQAAKRRETLHAWLFAIALGIFMGWSAVNFGGSVS